MRLSEKDKRLLLILAGILLFIVGYVGVFTPYAEKNDALKAEIEQLAPEFAKLKEYEFNLEPNKASIEKNRLAYEESINQFPNDVRAEDHVVFARDMVEDLEMLVNGGAFTFPEAFLQVRGVNMLSEDDYKTEVQNCYVYKTILTAECELSYESFKKAIDYVYRYPQKSSIEAASISYSTETGLLMGDIEVARYFVTGVNKDYAPSVVPPVPIGTENIFNSVQ